MLFRTSSPYAIIIILVISFDHCQMNFDTHSIFFQVTDWMLDRDPQEEVFKAFRLFDDDDSGKISLRNLRRVARELGENMTDEELRAMIDEFDRDGDGESELLCLICCYLNIYLCLFLFSCQKMVCQPFTSNVLSSYYHL